MSIHIDLTLPDWLSAFMEQGPRYYQTPSARMSLAVELAARNVLARTGGPFGAAIFDKQSGLLLGVGVNLVLASGLSMAHAEMVAIAVAQHGQGRLNLAGPGMGWQMATSCEPCSMCLGGIHWSGLKSVLIGARDADARAIGFDEGHKPVDWEAVWRADGMELERDLLRNEACSVLQAYASQGGVIYNG